MSSWIRDGRKVIHSFLLHVRIRKFAVIWQYFFFLIQIKIAMYLLCVSLMTIVQLYRSFFYFDCFLIQHHPYNRNRLCIVVVVVVVVVGENPKITHMRRNHQQQQ